MFCDLFDSSVFTSHNLERYIVTKVITSKHAFYNTCELMNPEIARYEKLNEKDFE